jgi:hypothetical protein
LTNHLQSVIISIVVINVLKRNPVLVDGCRFGDPEDSSKCMEVKDYDYYA